MANEKILVVDDEEDILELIRYNLAKEGYRVHCVTSGEEALQKAEEENPEVIVLDLMLPGKDGLDVCRDLRSPEGAPSAAAIIMLTAKGEDADIVAGLELGADDYITKPFSPRVLLARIKAVLRRRKRVEIDETARIKIRELTIDPARHEVTVSGKTVVLTASEFRILHFLSRRPGWVFSRDQIISAVKGDDYPVTDRSVDVQIAGLRKKLGRAGNLIETVRGVGYRFKE
jgi:two-component system, OmpR family, alkaline phosphatase synthesis response regulator PhoP